MIWGDLCHHPAQVTELWSPVFDMNPRQATASRDAVLQRIEDEKLRVDRRALPVPGLRRSRARRWQALLAGAGVMHGTYGACGRMSLLLMNPISSNGQ